MDVLLKHIQTNMEILIIANGVIEDVRLENDTSKRLPKGGTRRSLYNKEVSKGWKAR